jgi:Domain of Unknown Function (DUF1206)
MAVMSPEVNEFSTTAAHFYTGGMSGTGVKGVARTTRNSHVLHFLARVGFAVSGLLHGVIGIIAIEVAAGAAGDEADQSGALSQLAATPGGEFLLWLAVIGLAALGVWLLISAIFGSPQGGKKRVTHSLSQLGKAVVYFVLAFTALIFAQGGTTNSADSTRSLSANLLAVPGGVLLVVLIGLAVVGVGIYCIAKGVSRRFTRDIRMPRGALRMPTIVLAVFGYVAKGIAMGVVGVLFLTAAFTTNPSDATGLDGGLKALAALPLGMVILIVVGVGFIAYGVYSLVRARLAHL